MLTETNLELCSFFNQNPAISRNILGYGANAGLQLFDIAAASTKVSGHFYGTPFINGAQTFAPNQMTVGTARYNGSTFELFQHDISSNGQTASANYNLNTGDSTINIGGGVYSPYNNFNGDIAEILVYSGALSDNDRISVDNYLYNKYTTNPVAILEPGTLALMGILLVGLGFKKRKSLLSV
jgi:hypothetical protein